MAINKVIYGNTTLIDLTSDTATQDKVLSGYTFHDASGTLRTGTASSGSSATVLGGTLVAGNPTITFTDNAITATAMIDIFTNDNSVGWISRSVSGTTLTLIFPPQSSDLAVRVRLEETGE